MYEKVKVSSGSLKRNTRLNLGGFHVSSMDFCHNKVVDCKLMLPGDKVNLKIAHNLQMTPPIGFTIGKCNLQFKSFFVPARLCNQHFENFIESRETFTLGSTTSAKLPVSYNHILCAYLLQNFGFVSPEFKNKSKGYSEVSPWSDDTNQPLYINPLATGFNPNFALVEPIGICRDIQNGKPVDVLKFVDINTTKWGVGIALLNENEAGSGFVYDGKDYDVIAPFQHITSDHNFSSVAFDLYGFQIRPMVFDQQIGSAAESVYQSNSVYPYVLYRFTELGKRYYDLFISCGYQLNFGSPIFRDADQDFEEFDRHDLHVDSSLIQRMNIPFDQLSVFSSGSPSDVLISDSSSLIDIGEEWDLRYSHDDVTSRAGIGFYPSYISEVDTFVSQNTAIDSTRFNMMKLSGLLKIFVDYLCPSYFSRDFVQMTFNVFADPAMVYTTETFDLLRYFIISVYDKDYFSSSWQYPNSPTALNPITSSGTSSFDNGSLLQDNFHDGNEVQVLPNGTFVDTHEGVLSKIGLDALNALHKLFRLKGLAGSRYIDQLFARFGQKNSNARLQRSEFVGVMRSRFDVSLVMSNSDTDGASLGDYVSHGESRNSGSLGSYEVSEWGYLYIIASIVPLPMYFQGRERENLYNSPLDFWTPELDAIDSMQAVRQDELLSDSVVCSELQNAHSKYSPSGTFGYSRLWSEMKKGVDKMSGDFRLLSHGKYSNDSYHLFRVMPSLTNLVLRNGSLTSGLEFNYAHDKAQFDRIFQNTDSTFDHFMIFMQVDIFVTRNIKSITDFSFDDECDTIDRDIKNGGTELN